LAVQSFSGAETTNAAALVGHVMAQLLYPVAADWVPNPVTVVPVAVTTAQPSAVQSAALDLAVQSFSGAETTNAEPAVGHVMAQLLYPVAAD
jgi:hypothetical protein